MAVESTPSQRRLETVHDRRQDIAAALLATLAVLTIHAFGGFSEFRDSNGDNDALMRLVQVRDLIAGQGWFDLTQYRMGLDGGVSMHWSRLVDAPIAALVVAGTLLTGDQAAGEAFAAVAWPLTLYAASLFLILRIARRISGERALLPALVIGAISLHVSAHFAPGSLDHHTLQLVLTLALLNFLLADADNSAAAYGGGCAAAMMLAIGIEGLPYVAAGGICAAALFLLKGRMEAGRAARFGAAFAAASLCIFALTAPYGTWLVAQCDAFSFAQVSLATGAGLGLCAVAWAVGAKGTIYHRSVWLAVLGVGIGAVAILAFPQCLQSPYDDIEPRLRDYWLDGIVEARSVVDLLVHSPDEFFGFYATPILGLILLGRSLWQNGFRRQDLLPAAFLGSAVLVSFWQVRGAMFSLPLAVIPLSAWVAEWRVRAEAAPSAVRSLRLLLAWLLSFNLVWYTAAHAAGSLMQPQSPAADAAEDGKGKTCYRATDYDGLKALPPGTVLAVSNLGASILAHTGHRALAGPYHRNIGGNLLMLDTLTASGDSARRLLTDAGVDFVAFCPGNKESRNLARRSPAGLEAALRDDEVPQWLEPVAGDDAAALRIYRVVP